MATALPVWNGCTPNANPISGDSTFRDAASITTGAASAASASLSAAGLIGTTASLGAVTMGIGAAAVAVAELGFAVAKIFSGCGSTCTLASNAANLAEDKLNQVLYQWNNSPVRTQAFQLACLQIVVGTFQALCNYCSQASLGNAGVRCISERLIRGNPAPWCPTSTGCDWVTTYYDPIARATDVVPDATPAPPTQSTYDPVTGIPTQTDPGSGAVANQITSQTSSGAGQIFTGDNSALYIVIGLLVLAVLRRAHG